jgi:hypothetical protein
VEARVTSRVAASWPTPFRIITASRSPAALPSSIFSAIQGRHSSSICASGPHPPAISPVMPCCRRWSVGAHRTAASTRWCPPTPPSRRCSRSTATRSPQAGSASRVGDWCSGIRRIRPCAPARGASRAIEQRRGSERGDRDPGSGRGGRAWSGAAQEPVANAPSRYFSSAWACMNRLAAAFSTLRVIAASSSAVPRSCFSKRPRLRYDMATR